MILSPEYWNEFKGMFKQGELNFEVFKCNDFELLISEPIGNTENLKNSPQFGKGFMNFLDIKKKKGVAIEKIAPYGFDGQYLGWDFAVYPFLCYLKGVSFLGHDKVSAKIVHLPQSSGYGTTRLCFEVLKHEGRGIYSVFRVPERQVNLWVELFY